MTVISSREGLGDHSHINLWNYKLLPLGDKALKNTFYFIISEKERERARERAHKQGGQEEAGSR